MTWNEITIMYKTKKKKEKQKPFFPKPVDFNIL